MAEAWSNRRGFWIQVVAMVANDLVWLLFWLLFFRRFESVRGWEFADMVVLLSVLTLTGGIVLGLLANSRRIAMMIADGELDAALTLPAPTLAYLLVRRIDVTFVGDIFYGLLLFFLLAQPSPARFATFIFTTLLATAVLSGFLILVGSSAFYVGRNEFGDLSFHAVVLFASYPIDMFTGPTKFFLYAVVPAGFVSAVPTRLIADFQWQWAVLLFVVAVAFFSAGVAAFQRGLRRYASGAGWV